ncbi:hypothetical protein ACH4UV_38830 [Streptomyces sp. NPDC020802]|uniref:hypothetical protein n=1 Tax=Streptomyces sp. NPDC020802 TaxID=3365094 RepID=UPI0037A2E79E
MTAHRASEERQERFVRELAELKIPDPAAARAALWLRLGGLLMVAGLGLAGAAFPLAHGTDSALGQGDALALGLGGITAAVVGGALFLRYSLTGFLRFWLTRQSYDLDRMAERLTAALGPAAGRLTAAPGPATGDMAAAPGPAPGAVPPALETANTTAPEGDPRHGVVPRTDPAPR